MVENVKFFKAGFPAEYGGRVASVTDIQLKRSDFEEYHGQASIGLLSGNLHITGPIIEDRLAFSASVRRSWMELVTIPTLAIINNSKKKNGEKIIGRYSFTDINSIEDYGASLRASLSPSSNVKIEAGTEFIHHIYKPEELEITGSNGFGLATPYPPRMHGKVDLLTSDCRNP